MLESVMVLLERMPRLRTPFANVVGGPNVGRSTSSDYQSVAEFLANRERWLRQVGLLVIIIYLFSAFFYVGMFFSLFVLFFFSSSRFLRKRKK